jgi:hypothetical protein
MESTIHVMQCFLSLDRDKRAEERKNAIVSSTPACQGGDMIGACTVDLSTSNCRFGSPVALYQNLESSINSFLLDAFG